MPLVAHTNLPAFADLQDQGHELLSLDRALEQDIRELHIGFLNMMPDAALRATERQFIRLVGNSNRIAQFYVHPFTLPGLPRSEAAQDYIDQHYAQFHDLQEQGLDALIITGANVANPELSQEPFWAPLQEVTDWAQAHVTSLLCSCLATHAVLQQRYGIQRHPMARKRWGVYSHRVVNRSHPLLRDVNTRIDAPHSRYNDIDGISLQEAGLHVLAQGDAGGVLLASSRDGLREIYLQGHPEYDMSSLLKEYRREIARYANGDRSEPPPFPEGVFHGEAARLARDMARVAKSPAEVKELEQRIAPLLDNTWGDSAKAIFNNWLGLVYRVTDMDRKKPFMDGVDPANPLAGMPGIESD